MVSPSSMLSWLEKSGRLPTERMKGSRHTALRAFSTLPPESPRKWPGTIPLIFNTDP